MITAIMIGAGQRGYEVYGKAALGHPDRLKFIAVAEPNNARRLRFATEHGILAENCFCSWEDVFSRGKIADAAFICTQDREHTKPALMALEAKYAVLLEKPMSFSSKECIALGQAAETNQQIFNICHVLRYSQFYTEIKKIVDSGALGKIVNIRHSENVGFWHQAHSFVRGNWRNDKETSPMILQKCCHDMDILLWLIGSRCENVSSFGALSQFTAENAPEGSAARCTDNCLVKETCIYNAERFYLSESVAWPASVISEDPSIEARREALKNGPYGRCVYQCDNNVVDHQIVALEFEGGTTATVTMCAFTQDCTRFTEIMGTKGYLRAEMNKFGETAKANEIQTVDFLSGERKIFYVNDHGLMTGHEGADVALTLAFVDQVEAGNTQSRTAASRSVESHLMSLAAEKSRREKRRVSLKEMWES